MTPLSSLLWVKWYHYCSSRRMALVSNNARRLICHLKKKHLEHLCKYFCHFLFRKSSSSKASFKSIDFRIIYNIKMKQKFCNISVCAGLWHAYHIVEPIQAVVATNCGVSSIMVVGVLACCALLHSMWDSKAAQMNVQHSLIQELMLYKFKLDHNIKKTIKNICCAKGKGVIDYSTVTRWVKKFCSGCKNLDNQTRSGRLKTEDSEAMLQAINCPVSWGCRIHWLLQCRGAKTPLTSVLIWQFDGQVPVMLELWGMQSTSSLLLLPDPL